MTDKKKEALRPQDLMEQIEQLKESASKDTLTGLLNRGTAERYIRTKLAAMRPGDMCAMFIIDLDEFKKVNDTLGHQVGDKTLCQASKILSGLFRANDIVGRLGGDEFVVFLCGRISEELVKQKGYLICERLQLSVGDEDIIFVTASVGICLAKEPGRQFEDLYRQADQAMYEAKRGGRRRYHLKNDSYDQNWSPDTHFTVNPIKLDRILEHIDSGVALLDAESPYSYIYVSPGFRRMTGLGSVSVADIQREIVDEPEEHSVENGFLNIVFRDDRFVFERMVKKAHSGDEVNQSVRVKAFNGEYIWCRLRTEFIEHEEGVQVLMVSITDISELKEEEKSLKEQNERLQAAFDQTGQEIWEVDLATGLFHLHSDREHGIPTGKGLMFPEELIANGWVRQDSVAVFRAFAKELYEGNIKGYGNFALRYPYADGHNWVSMSYNMIFDDEGSAVRAVGILENFSDGEGEDQLPNARRKTVPESILPFLILHVHGNLTKDTVEEIWEEGKYRPATGEWASCTAFLKRAEDKVFSREDKRKFLERFNMENMNIAYEEGKVWQGMEYRRIDGSGNIQWVHIVVNLYKKPESDDLMVFLYLALTEHRHRWEAELGVEILRDPVTKLYSRYTARLISEGLINKNISSCYGMALIKMKGIVGLYDGSTEETERRRFYLSSILNIALGVTSITAQYSRDRILVFFPDMSSESKMREHLLQTYDYVRMVAEEPSGTDGVQFVAGCVWTQAGETSYDAMFQETVRLCELWQDTPGDKVAFPDDAQDWNWKEIRKEGEEGQVCIPLKDVRRPLTEREKDTALECMTGMIMSDSLENSMQILLSNLGGYYNADRAYILSLAESRHIVTMPCEWVAQGRHSIQQTMSGTLVERLPILGKCIEEGTPLFLSRKTKKNETWRFIIFPMEEAGKANSFLCVENAKENTTENALPLMLIPYILREKQRYHSSRRMSAFGDSSFHDDMPNLRAYLDTIYGFTSEQYTSLGAVCVDIPELASLNSNFGFEYGRRLLWFVSQSMANVFGKTYLYRTWDSEFVALCPNTTQQVFLGRCNRLRSVLQSRYPGNVRIGNTWSEGVFAGKSLVEEARSIMHCERVTVWDIPLGYRKGKPEYGSLGEAIKAGRFTVFFQPKVDMVTGELLGAEALARGLDMDGNIIPPARFVEQLEQKGIIRDLDLFILDRTMYILDQWREQGYEVVPVSVNFSRVTLFDPTVLASVLAIQSRYPDIDSSFIEVEITESAGDISQATLKDMVQRFRQYGIRFALDDFGSKYSNLAIFANVQFDTVKLDRSLVASIAENEMSRVIVRDIAELCRKNGMACVAEGVETREQIGTLVQSGCTCGQGYFYDRPIVAERFKTKYLHKIDSE